MDALSIFRFALENEYSSHAIHKNAYCTLAERLVNRVKSCGHLREAKRSTEYTTTCNEVSTDVPISPDQQT